jgi:hypothetical protein
MARFAVAFVTPAKNGLLIHKVIESESRESALKTFFEENVNEFYSNNAQGFHYFKEDFFDDTTPSGSIIEL